MKVTRLLLALAVLLGWQHATAQTIFNQDFDGGYTGSFSLSHYGSGGTGTSTTELTSGGNPNGCLQMAITTTGANDYYTGQAQFETVSGNTDPNPSDYVLSFDAKGSQAANIVFIIEVWQGQNFTGTQIIPGARVNDQLSAANTWQTFSVNLGTVTTAAPTGGTWQLNFQITANQWGGSSITDTLTVDNIKLVHIANNPALTSSANPSYIGQSVNITATVKTNGVAATDATGQVVFSSGGTPFSTNTIVNGAATSLSLANLPAGSNLITCVYSGGNYPASTNTFSQYVNFYTPADLPIFTDNMVNGFQNWSGATVNLQTQNPAPHSGAYCISVTDNGNQAVQFHNQDFNTGPYASFSFWVNGGATGGQHLKVYGLLDGAKQVGFSVPALSTGWQQVVVPLNFIGISNKPNCSDFWIQGTTGSAQPTFYVDDVELVGLPTPPVVHLGLNATQTVGTVDARQFGFNTATWDGNLGNSTTLPLLKSIGCQALRWPGGSTSDGYDWTTDPNGNATFRNLATNLGAQVFITVNYGSGTPSLAASWVTAANQTYHCGFKYWEIGNECYGSWENDTHPVQHDPYTYATNAVAFIQAMKAAYPTVPIKVGVVVVPGEDSYANNQNHSATNPRTHAAHYGWTPVVLATMQSADVLPDFLIYHYYAQYTGSWAPFANSSESDALLMQIAGNPSPSNWNDWASAAANLRQQLTDYLGSSSSNIELCVTENNCDAGVMGRQSTSLVNALYLADSACELMKTEFRSYIWWDLHNGSDTSGDMDPTLYGWRMNGDYGILNGSNVPYPTFYAEKLLQSFARPGDTVLNGTSDNLLLSAYATRRTNGALTLLVINKSLLASQNGQISLTNFAPGTTATVQSFGIPQDQAAEYNLSASAQDIATNSATVAANFTYNFPPLSLTLFTFTPGPSRLSVTAAPPGQLNLQIQGQAGTPYVIQSATSLTSGTWTSISTNLLSDSSTNILLAAPPNTPQQFYRAVWLP